MTTTLDAGGGSDGVFLATTALEEFWDTSGPILFAGEWCRLPERAAVWRALDAEVLPDQWDDPPARRSAEAYCAERVTQVLSVLTGFLNALHDERHDVRYWRILLGPWLFHFTHALYDRFRLLERALDSHPRFVTRVLATDSWVTPRDWADYTYLVFGDGYNLQLFSQLLAVAGHRFPAAEHVVRPHRPVAAAGAALRLRGAVREVYGKCLSALGAGRPVLLHGSRLRRSELWRLVLATRFRVWPFEPKLETDPVELDPKTRRELAALTIPGADLFTTRLLATLSINLPAVYLEGYRRLRVQTAAVRRGRTRVVVSGLGWKSNERFKCVAADAAERGGRLIGLQHGGASWVTDHSPMDSHMTQVVDEYWSWGCPEPGVNPVPDPRLSQVCARSSGPPGAGGALFVGTTFNRFVTSFRSQPIGGQVAAYIADQAAFFTALSRVDRSRFLVRLYPHELGWRNKERLSDSVPDLRFDDFSRSVDERLNESALVVVDNLQTTFIDVLCANRPVVLFYAPRLWAMSPAVAPLLEQLGAAGVLQPTPAAAAHQVSRVLEAPGAWWEARLVRLAREAFLDWCIDRRPWLPVWRNRLTASIGSSAVRSSA